MKWRPEGWQTLPDNQVLLQQGMRILYTKQELFEAGADAMLEALKNMPNTEKLDGEKHPEGYITEAKGGFKGWLVIIPEK